MLGPRARRVFFTSLIAGSITFAAASCAPADEREFSFYDARVQPILTGGCQRQSTGCHVDDGDGFALGNLDLSSYDALIKRADTLAAYGPYPVGLLLLKAGDPVEINVRTADAPDPENPDARFVRITTDIRHAAGEGAIAEGSADYAALKQWIERGYSRDGVPRDFAAVNRGECSGGVARVPGMDLAAEPADRDSYETFVDSVQPILRSRCAGSSCHGAQSAGLKLSCGDTDEELRSNYNSVIRYVNEVAVSSELLRRPLAQARGGVYYEGGDIFLDTDDSDYRVLRSFAEDIADRVPELLRFEPEDEGLRFFANRVQPVLVKKGCMFLGCHSPAMFHDLRLRGGAGGDFSEIATRRNHDMSKLLLALESEDPNASRLIAKNLCPPDADGHGIKHRGGVLLEDFGGCASEERQASVAQCESFDADNGNLDEVPAYCVLARWHAIERDLAIERGELSEPSVSGGLGVAYVSRPRGVGNPTEFDDFKPGADLLWSDVTFDAEGVPSLAAPRSLLASCGLANADVRGPAVSWDASRIAFAARTDENTGLQIFEVRTDGSQCAPIAGLSAGMIAASGIMIHDFDPAYAPDGRIVFASSRGYIAGDLDVRGPTRTPARLQPNANLFVFDGGDSSVRQLTFLLDQELSPAFMADGRVILTAEKRALDFHQLAGRRINLDGGDYHPLFAQRGSVGFESATEIVELANRNLAMVASTLGARDGGGSIVIVNRSIGPDQDDRASGDRAYIHSITAPISGALAGDIGVFRSPAPLPDGSLLASCDLGATDLNAEPHYALCWLDSAGLRRPAMLMSDGERSIVEAVVAYPRPKREIFRSRLDEANGATDISSDDRATVHYLDIPMLGTLLFSNTREGRPIDERVAGVQFLVAAPPPSSLTSLSGDDVVEDELGRYYESLTSLGWIAAANDGSAKVRLPAGVPLLTLALTGPKGDILPFPDGGAFSGPMRQRESFQLYPGERTRQSMPRRLFDGICAGCHGSVSGAELDVGVRVDVLTSASLTEAGRTEELLGR